MPPSAFVVPARIDIHGTLEGDDCRENLLMWQRTGDAAYLRLAHAWKDYYLDPARYLADLQADSFAQHTFGWGLLDWAVAFPADAPDCLVAVERIAAWIEPKWVTPTGGEAGYYGVRGPARQLHLVARLAHATDSERWIALRDRVLDVLLASPHWWDERGFVTQGEWGTDSQFGAGTYARHARQISTLLSGIFAAAALAVLDTMPQPELARRLRLMAAWTKAHALHPVHQQTGSGMLVERDGRIAFVHFDLRGDQGIVWEPGYTAMWVNLLTWAGEVDTAAHFWDRAVRGVQGDVTARGPGRFADGSYSGGGPFMPGDGDLQYVDRLFPAVTGDGPAPPRATWNLLPNTALAPRLAKYGGNPEGVLSYGGFALVILDGTPWIVLLWAGGHGAWGPSLVPAFPLHERAVPVWQVFAEPPMPVQLAEHLPDHEYRAAGKLVAPPAAHLYNGTQGLAGALAVRYGGSLWSEVTGNDPRVYLYDLKARTVRRGRDIPGTQGWSNPGTCTAVDQQTGEFVVWEVWGLYAYAASVDLWRQIGTVGRGGDSADAYRTACIDPLRRELFTVGGGKCQAASLFTGAVRDIALTGTGAWIKDAPAPGLEWDPDLNLAVAWHNGLVLIDPAAGTATAVEAQGEPGRAREEGVYGAFRRYGPGKYVLMTSTLAPLALLTLSLDGVPTEPPPLPPEVVPMKATLLPRIKGDVGEHGPSPTPVDNERILLTEIPGAPLGVTISAPGVGGWLFPKDSFGHWVPRITPQGSGATMLQFRSFTAPGQGQPVSDFTVKAVFAGNREATARAEPEGMPTPTTTPPPGTTPAPTPGGLTGEQALAQSKAYTDAQLGRLKVTLG